jgi:hypothetical protein
MKCLSKLYCDGGTKDTTILLPNIDTHQLSVRLNGHLVRLSGGGAMDA